MSGVGLGRDSNYRLPHNLGHVKVSVLLLVWTVSAVCASTHPAKDALAELQKSFPTDPQKWVTDILAKTPDTPAGMPRVMIIGDSWADVVAIGGNESFFERKLKEHGCRVTSKCLAIPGSTSGMWVKGILLSALKLAVAVYKPDYVWMTLVGNDALDLMPSCAKTGKSEKQCADELLGTALPNIYKIVDAIHDAHPAARVTGFGYDTMFGGLGCRLLTHDIFPQCWSRDVPWGYGNRCFNTQFLRIQEGWDSIAGNRSFVDPVSILGATQVAAGDAKASTDPNDRHINMDAMGPAKYWPSYLGCFHPSITPDNSDDSGAMVVMEEFYKVYWSKQLSCDTSKFLVV